MSFPSIAHPVKKIDETNDTNQPILSFNQIRMSSFEDQQASFDSCGWAYRMLPSPRLSHSRGQVYCLRCIAAAE